jgi:hypothetical protein
MTLNGTRLLALVLLVLVAGPVALAADPGAGFPVGANRPVSDDKAGSVLFYNIYTSAASNPVRQNTRISITNTSSTSAVAVHLFFIDGANCSPADKTLCLTQEQTTTFLTSEQDPGITGFIIAIAVQFDGLPRQFNFLIGDEYVKFESGHSAALGAEALAKTTNENVPLPDPSVTTLFFDSKLLPGSYDALPRVLAVDNIPSRADGNDTLIILNSVSGGLRSTMTSFGALFGILFDDAEQAHSFTFAAGCQLRGSLSNSFPRTTPRFETVIPAGQTGWLKIWPIIDLPILGCVINSNPNAAANASAFNGGHNLQKLKLSAGAASLFMPVFPPGCSGGFGPN